jgi:hypothetical protein
MAESKDPRAALYQAYSDLAKNPHVVMILDDIQTFINSLPGDQQGPAWRVYGWLQLRASALRREKARGPVTPAKTR